MKKIMLNIFFIFLWNIFNGYSQNNSALYLYFDKNNPKQVTVQNQEIFSSDYSKTYQGDIYWYRYPILHGEEWLCFVTFPQKRSFEIPLEKLKQFQPLNIQELKKQLFQLSQGWVYGIKEMEFFDALHKIYLVQLNVANNKARIIEVKLVIDPE